MVDFVLVLVGVSAVEVDCKRQNAEARQEPVEVIEMASVEVIGEPAVATISSAGYIDCGDEKAADEAPDAKYAQVQRQPKGSQPIWHLVVEEFL